MNVYHITESELEGIRMIASHMTVNDLHDTVEALSENLGEVESQHQSETACYGDSWPGAQIEISNMGQCLGVYRDVLAYKEQTAGLEADFNEQPVSDWGANPEGYLN